jgi:hypothetical protein
MAPPLPLASVAGSLALSFTAARAAPTTTAAEETASPSVPTPPRLPPVPGETTEPATTEPATTEPATTEPATAAPLTVQPVARPTVDVDEDDLPGPPKPTPERLLRPNTKSLMFSLFVGGSRALRGGYSYFGTTDFKSELAIGGHDRRFRKGGFAVLQITSGFPFSTFTLAPRLSLNRQIVPDHAIYFTTNLTLGYRATSYGGYGVILGPILGGAIHSAVMGVSWGASTIIGERLLLSFRPLELELVVPAPALVQINWAAMGGLGIVWGKRND